MINTNPKVSLKNGNKGTFPQFAVAGEDYGEKNNREA